MRTELLLGARLALARGGESRWRTGLTALGVALGVALLLAAASVPNVVDAHRERTAGRSDLVLGPQPKQSERSLLIAILDSRFGDDILRVALVRPEGAHAPVPPGLDRIPAAGETVVSPALRDLLHSRDGQQLRARVPGRIVGTIGDSGLAGPHELAFYAGSDALRAGGVGVNRIERFGTKGDFQGFDPTLTVLALTGLIVLLLPIAIFVATAARFGGEGRDRRLAAMRLVGADRSMAMRVAAGESLVAGALGVVLGVAGFIAARPLASQIELFDLSAFARDVDPSPGFGVLALLGVPALSVAVTLLALRRVSIEPLGVVRESGPRRRRLAWRLALPVVGLALLAPLLGTVSEASGNVSSQQLVIGIGLLLLGVTAVLPWIVETTVRRLGRGPVPWQLAVRRLQLDSGTSTRVVGGVAVAVAGAIALQTLLASVVAQETHPTGQDTTRADVSVYLPGVDPTVATDRLRATAGVTAVTAYADVGTRGERVVGSCAALRELARLARCADGDAFRIKAPGSILPRGTGALRDAPVVQARTDPQGGLHSGFALTPGAARGIDVTRTATSAFVSLAPGRRNARLETLRETAAMLTPLGQVTALAGEFRTRNVDVVRRILLAGAILVLVIIGMSLLVATAESMRERRRALAVLVAMGVRPRTLAWSVLWQSAIAVGAGVLVATVAGLLLGVILLRIVTIPLRFDTGAIVITIGAAAAVVLAVTAAGLPVLHRLMRPEGLRTE